MKYFLNKHDCQKVIWFNQGQSVIKITKTNRIRVNIKFLENITLKLEYLTCKYCYDYLSPQYISIYIYIKAQGTPQTFMYTLMAVMYILNMTSKASKLNIMSLSNINIKVFIVIACKSSLIHWPFLVDELHQTREWAQFIKRICKSCKNRFSNTISLKRS